MHRTGNEQGFSPCKFSANFKGTFHHPKIAYHTARNVRIEGADAPYYADGEPLGHAPVEIRLQPKALTVLAPLQPAGAENRHGQPKAEDQARKRKPNKPNAQECRRGSALGR